MATRIHGWRPDDPASGLGCRTAVLIHPARLSVCYHMTASDIMRTIIQLPDEQAEQLVEVSRNQGISRAEAVRRALARYLTEHRQRRREDAFGMWSGRREDGLAYERRLRKEWP